MYTGLACYLAGWKTPQTLESGAMGGAMLETYVVSEIIKNYWHNGKQPSIYYYRDKDKREIDILLEQDGIVYPIVIPNFFVYNIKFKTEILIKRLSLLVEDVPVYRYHK